MKSNVIKYGNFNVAAERASVRDVLKRQVGLNSVNGLLGHSGIICDGPRVAVSSIAQESGRDGLGPLWPVTHVNVNFWHTKV